MVEENILKNIKIIFSVDLEWSPQSFSHPSVLLGLKDISQLREFWRNGEVVDNLLQEFSIAYSWQITDWWFHMNPCTLILNKIANVILVHLLNLNHRFFVAEDLGHYVKIFLSICNLLKWPVPTYGSNMKPYNIYSICIPKLSRSLKLLF